MFMSVWVRLDVICARVCGAPEPCHRYHVEGHGGHQRLAARSGFSGHNQWENLFAAGAAADRPRVGDRAGRVGGVATPVQGVHRLQAQVGWGVEGAILAHRGVGEVYSFHMTLSYSRDSFCCRVRPLRWRIQDDRV
jgi:hypothetical protein